MSKVFERIIHDQLYSYSITNNLLNECNSGFKKFDSAINRLISITNDIHKGLDKHKEIILIFLDISKAFDRVWPPGMLFKLKQNGVDGCLLRWFESYLNNRSQRVNLGGKSSHSHKLHAGVPQGYILGPLLFLIYINDLPTNLITTVNQFADDTTLLETITTPTESIRKINLDLQKIREWALQWRVTFNPDKTYFLRISNKQIKPILPSIIFNNTIVQEVQSHTNLGLTFNNKFTWDDHINRISNKAAKRVTIINRHKYLLPRDTLERTYLTIIRPVLEYADVIYDNTTLESKNILDKIQRRAGIICTGAYRHTENRSLLHELGWESLSLRRKNHKIIQYYKIINRLTPNYLTQEIPNTISTLTNYHLRNRHQLREQKTRLSSSYNSFFPSTTRLPLTLKNLPTFKSFKYNLTKKRKQPLYHRLCSGRKGNWLTRMRLGLSALNAHRFKYNFIHTPNCNQCHTDAESTKHYFFNCLAYSLPRLRLLERLRDEIEMDTDNKTLLLHYFLHGTNNLLTSIRLKKIVCDYMVETGRFK
jgi:ribonuclease P/MRP protein subunit RPP40